MNSDQKQQVIDTVANGANILVTVSNSPSVDQLSAMIGLTLLVNKMDKHGAAVFSGEVPSTLSFLKPDETVEKDTDSLRDFIISLDKAKADKLRYKVEEDVVKIFITPYKTALLSQDFTFSQGDFNVDVVIALGVTKKEDLDRAITAHGRILHDLGSIDWQNQEASSLCEMVTSLCDHFQAGLLDEQISTALLTGIVAETGRFRNEKTTPAAMTMAADLIASGANQQLIANKLETQLGDAARRVVLDEPAVVVKKEEQVEDEVGVLRLDHVDEPAPKQDSTPEEVISPLVPATLTPATPATQSEQKIEEETAATTLPEPSVIVQNDAPLIDSATVSPPSEQPTEEPAPAVEVSAEPPVTVPAPAKEEELITIPEPIIEEKKAPVVTPAVDQSAIHIDEHGNLNPVSELGTSEAAEQPIISHGIKVIQPLPPVTHNLLETSPSTPAQSILQGSDFNATTAEMAQTAQEPPALDFQLHDQPAATPVADIAALRDGVKEAIAAAPYDELHPEPRQSTGAQNVDLDTKTPEPAKDIKTPEAPKAPTVPPPIIPPLVGNATNPYINPSSQPGSITLPQ
jgi:nanoRNase/pAp phosphatase (c-di-AMP/oligoRNAs hydrolase)